MIPLIWPFILPIIWIIEVSATQRQLSCNLRINHVIICINYSSFTLWLWWNLMRHSLDEYGNLAAFFALMQVKLESWNLKIRINSEQKSHHWELLRKYDEIVGDSQGWTFFLFAGLFVGALIRYAATNTTATHLNVSPTNNNQTPTYNQSLPPDTLWLMVIEYHPFWMYYIKYFVYFHLKSFNFLSKRMWYYIKQYVPSVTVHFWQCHICLVSNNIRFACWVSIDFISPLFSLFFFRRFLPFMSSLFCYSFHLLCLITLIKWWSLIDINMLTLV